MDADKLKHGHKVIQNKAAILEVAEQAKVDKKAESQKSFFDTGTFCSSDSLAGKPVNEG